MPARDPRRRRGPRAAAPRRSALLARDVERRSASLRKVDACAAIEAERSKIDNDPSMMRYRAAYDRTHRVPPGAAARRRPGPACTRHGAPSPSPANHWQPTAWPRLATPRTRVCAAERASNAPRRRARHVTDVSRSRRGRRGDERSWREGRNLATPLRRSSNARCVWQGHPRVEAKLCRAPGVRRRAAI